MMPAKNYVLNVLANLALVSSASFGSLAKNYYHFGAWRSLRSSWFVSHSAGGMLHQEIVCACQPQPAHININVAGLSASVQDRRANAKDVCAWP